MTGRGSGCPSTGSPLTAASWRCKNTNYHRRGEWEDDEGEIVADGAEAQGQHALAVTGLPHVWFAAQVGGQPPVIRRIERDEAFIADLTAAEGEFWQLVEARTPPALEGRASADLIARLYPQADDGKTAELSAADVALLREYRKELANENAARGAEGRDQGGHHRRDGRRRDRHARR